ncbi:MAG: sulfatase [Acidobacteriota bacterium]|jgi:arylsulfatase A-like enzyme
MAATRKALPTLLISLGIGLVLALACAPAPRGEAPGAWRRLDLTTTAPAAVEQNVFGAEPAWEAGIGYLGSEEVRDMRRVPESQLEAFPFRRAPQIRVLTQPAGTRLAWPVELGASPYVSFIPIGWRGLPCPCLYRLGLRDARGGLHELYRAEVDQVEPLAPGAVEIDLTDFSESRVELLFQVDVRLGAPQPSQPGGPGTDAGADAVPAADWGSPAVYDRALGDPAADGAGRWRAGDDRPNVLLLGLDTLRADHVGPWRPRPSFTPSLTPAIDRLAEESDVWLRAYSTFNSTNPSFASIFTGLYGKNHGVYDLQTPLPEEHRTLAELFSEAGYETLATISASHLGDHNSGLGQGFDQVLLTEHTFAAELPADHFMGWIAERDPGAPFFAWLHLFDPHTPHTPPEPYSTGLRPWRASGLAPVAGWIPFRRPEDRTFTQPVLGGQTDLYAGEVAYLDRQVDRLVGYLESRGLLERTVLVLVADHGENLGEHGIDFRHLGLWETTTHVPLLIRWPEDADRPGAGRRFDGLVQTIDLFPTLLWAAGIEVPPSDGVDLHRLTAEGRTGRRAVFAEHAGPGGPAGAMVRTPTHRYMRVAGVAGVPDGASLYDLEADPDEERDLTGAGLPVERDLQGLLDRWLQDRRERVEAERRNLTEEERKKLEALGYL